MQGNDYLPAQLNINENISEINASNKNNAMQAFDDRATTLGGLSIFNDKKGEEEAQSPVRRPAQQILDDHSVRSKRDSGALIGLTGMDNKISRQNIQVGSARLSGVSQKDGVVGPPRLGNYNQSKRSSPIKSGVGKLARSNVPKYQSDKKKQPGGVPARHLRQSNNYTDQHLMETSPPPQPDQYHKSEAGLPGEIFRNEVPLQQQDSQQSSQKQSQLPP